MSDLAHEQAEPKPGDGDPPDSRIERVERIFQHARRLPANERGRFIADECGADAELRDEVESLLAQLSDDDVKDSFLSGSAIGMPLKAHELDPMGAADDDSPQAVPARIGQYTIIRKLGEGGMGVVYLVEQEATNRRVALKVIHGFARSPMLLKRFEHEAQVLGRLRHPGIAQVYQAGVHETEHGRLPFIAMELIDGMPILEFAAKRKLSERERIELMIRVCDAVYHAHQHGVVHRDLKPANILVEEAGPKPGHDHASESHPHIVDFGIARVLDEAAGTTMHTRTGQLIGTLEYMSPEQAAGDPAAVDARADVYAIGVVLYELIAGKPPLELTTHALYDAVRIIRDDDPAPLSSINRRYRGDLTTIVGKALEKDQQRRYQSARELADDLTRYLRDEPILAHRPSTTYQLRKFARRHRALIAATLAIAVMLVSATIVSTRQALRAGAAQQVAEREQLRAEEHLADAHHLARTMLFELDNVLVNVTGALPARQLLVERGLTFLDKFAEQAGDDPELLRELAVGYVLIGDVQGDTQRPNIGDFDGAIESYRRAVEILDAHMDQMPLQAKYTLFLAVTKIGDQLVHRGDYTGSIDLYERSLRIARDRDNLNEQGQAHARLADVLIALGRGTEASEHRREAQRITRELLAESPDDLGRKRDLAVRHFETGLDLLASDPAAALAEFETFVAICEELVEADPEHAVYQRDVAIGVQRMGHALEAMGRLDDALPLFERELAIMQRLADADPDDYQARAGVAAPCVKIGEVYLARGDLLRSLDYFQRYLSIAEECVAQNPSDAAIQRDLGVAYYKMNQWHAHQSADESLGNEDRLAQWREARRWLQQCHDHFIMMRERGMLRPVDADVPDVLLAELDGHDQEIQELVEAAGAESD